MLIVGKEFKSVETIKEFTMRAYNVLNRFVILLWLYVDFTSIKDNLKQTEWFISKYWYLVTYLVIKL